MCGKEIMGVRLRENRDVAAVLLFDLRGKKGHRKGVLVIVWDQPALDGIADCLPALVVLIEDMAPF